MYKENSLLLVSSLIARRLPHRFFVVFSSFCYIETFALIFRSSFSICATSPFSCRQFVCSAATALSSRRSNTPDRSYSSLFTRFLLSLAVSWRSFTIFAFPQFAAHCLMYHLLLRSDTFVVLRRCPLVANCMATCRAGICCRVCAARSLWLLALSTGGS